MLFLKDIILLYKKTIFALSTFYGKSALAIVRITGLQVLTILYKFNIRNNITPNKISLVKIYTKNTIFIDECLVIFFQNGKSYTGVELIELQVHGSIAVINKIFNQLFQINNFRMALPGEFTKLALTNNKISFDKAEAISDLINAETNAQHYSASQIYNGDLKKIQIIIKNMFIEIIGQLEAFIDFPGDMFKYIKTINQKVILLKKLINKIIDSFNISSLLKNGINISIIGDSNSGKSTLMNLLTKTNRSITSNISGTTRDIVIDKIEILGIPIILHDTAGIRYSNDIIESIGIEKTLHTIKNSSIIIFVHNINIKINLKILNYIKKYNTVGKFIFISNKIDLIDSKKKYFSQCIKINNCKIKSKYKIFISLNRDSSHNSIINILVSIIKYFLPMQKNIIITSLRQQKILKNCLEYINKASSINEFELKVEEFKNAANKINELIGIISSKEILNQVFTNFCIGK